MDNPAPPTNLGVAQLVEHPVWGGEVAGSLPVTQTNMDSNAFATMPFYPNYYPQVKPNVCPGCGRCGTCGQPSLPYYAPVPYWSQQDPNLPNYTVTCGGTHG